MGILRIDTLGTQSTSTLGCARRPLRALLVEPQSAGGFWHYVNSLAHALAGAGADIHIATVEPYEVLPGRNSLPVWAIGAAGISRAPLVTYPLRRAGNLATKLLRVRKLIDALRPDVVHLHGRLGMLDFPFLAHLRARGVGLVYTAHNPRPRSGRNGWLDLARYRQVDAIIVLSTQGRRDLVDDGVRKDKILYIPHGNYIHFCDAGNLNPRNARQLLGLSPDARTILFFGGIAPHKGLGILIDALARQAQNDASVRLIIAGKPFENMTPYLQALARKNLERNVLLDLRWIPFEEMPKYFLASDVVVFPYRQAYQSGVLQLAYGFGRPVVVTDVGELGVTVAEDGTGIVAKAVTSQDLAEAINRALGNREAAERMGRRGRHLAETKYSWEAIAQRCLDVYASITSCKR